MHSEKEKDRSDAGSNQLGQDQLQHTVTDVTFSTPMVYLVKFSASHSAVEVVALEIRQANDLATGQGNTNHIIQRYLKMDPYFRIQNTLSSRSGRVRPAYKNRTTRRLPFSAIVFAQDHALLFRARLLGFSKVQSCHRNLSTGVVSQDGVLSTCR